LKGERGAYWPGEGLRHVRKNSREGKRSEKSHGVVTRKKKKNRAGATWWKKKTKVRQKKRIRSEKNEGKDPGEGENVSETLELGKSL